MSMFGLSSIAQQAMLSAGAAPPIATDIEYVGGELFQAAAISVAYDFQGLTGGIGSPQAGDLYVVFWVSSDFTSTVIPTHTPASDDFETIATAANANQTANGSFVVGIGRIEDPATDSGTFTVPAPESSQIAVMVFRGVDQDIPIDVLFNAPTISVGSALPNPPSITPLTNKAMIISLGGASWSTTAKSFVDPTDGTTRRLKGDYDGGASSGRRGFLMASTRVWTTGDGPFDPAIFAYSDASNATSGVTNFGYTFALRFNQDPARKAEASTLTGQAIHRDVNTERVSTLKAYVIHKDIP
jgi:hypothetical protein